MIDWYDFSPVDTMFFRGAESLEKGSDHRASTMFPPSPETFFGALRTLYLIEHEIPFHHYNRSDFRDEKVIEAIGRSDDEPDALPWSLIGPLIKKGEEVYVPAPYSWFTKETELKEYFLNNKNKDTGIEIIRASEIDNSLLLMDSDLLWVKGKSEEMKCLGGMWVNLSSVMGTSHVKVLDEESVFHIENRTGIALEGAKKHVRKGHLFSMNHIRLQEGISLVFGITGILYLPDTGILMLGGENRFGKYRKVNIDFPDDPGKEGLYLSLGSIDGTCEGISEEVLATGKINYMGGWNMRIGFHKPLKGYYPAGTVLSSKINENCLYLEEKNG